MGDPVVATPVLAPEMLTLLEKLRQRELVDAVREQRPICRVEIGTAISVPRGATVPRYRITAWRLVSTGSGAAVMHLVENDDAAEVLVMFREAVLAAVAAPIEPASEVAHG